MGLVTKKEATGPRLPVASTLLTRSATHDALSFRNQKRPQGTNAGKGEGTTTDNRKGSKARLLYLTSKIIVKSFY